jgi:uncharacterized protein (UPF0297 family)
MNSINYKLATAFNASGDAKVSSLNSVLETSYVYLGNEAYDSIGQLPLIGVDSGQLAYVSSTNNAYINNGIGWYKIDFNTDSV